LLQATRYLVNRGTDSVAGILACSWAEKSLGINVSK